MATQRLNTILGLVLISLLVCGSSFAQPGIESGQTDIPIPDTAPDNLVTYQSEASKLVFEQVQAQYSWVIGQLNSIQAASTDPVEIAQIEKVKELLQDKKTNLRAIDVYFGNPGTIFDDLVNFYNGKIALEDLVQKAENTASDKKGMSLVQALSQVPTDLLSLDAKAELNSRLNNLKAMAGAAGNSRMTFSNVFVEPNVATPSNPDIKDQLVIVIATKKTTP